MDALQYHYGPVYSSVRYTGKTLYLLCYKTSSLLLFTHAVFSRKVSDQIISASAGNVTACYHKRSRYIISTRVEA